MVKMGEYEHKNHMNCEGGRTVGSGKGASIIE